jgi:pimeloyl-ACP methyl ester carboxylesterase
MPYHIVGSHSWPASIFYRIHEPQNNVEAKGNVLGLMGLMAEGLAWEPQVEYLTSQGYRVATYDHRGIGRSSARLGRYTTELLAMDALDLMTNGLGWQPHQTHVISISMGGMICLEILSHLAGQGSRLKSATLMVTQAAGYTSGNFAPISTMTTMLRAMFGSGTLREKQILSMSCAFSSEWLSSPEPSGVLTSANVPSTNMDKLSRRSAANMAAKVEEGKRKTPSAKGVVGQLLAVTTHYVSPSRLDGIRAAGTPLLIVGAKQDRLIKFNNHEYLAEKLEPLQFLVVDGSHCVHEEHTVEVNSAIMRLIQHSETITSPL